MLLLLRHTACVPAQPGFPPNKGFTSPGCIISAFWCAGGTSKVLTQPHCAQMLFGSGERLLGTERAFILAALGLIPAVAPWALDFLQLWRARCAVSELLAASPTARFLRGQRAQMHK